MPIIAITPEQPFSRVYVDFLVKGGTRVSWEIKRCMTDPTPWTFQLQVNRNSDEPDNWEDVGDPVGDTFFSVDTQQRLYGKDHRLAYRVELTTNNDTYISENAHIFGELTTRQWTLANAIIRRAKLERSGLNKPRGYLLKRKLYGTACSCVDTLTGLTTDPDCQYCRGTGKVNGYWNSTEITLYDLTPSSRESKTDEQLARGTVNDATQKTGVFIGFPFINSKDVWVLSGSDRRYNIGEIKNVAEINGVPLVTQVSMKLLPFTDQIYQIDV